MAKKFENLDKANKKKSPFIEALTSTDEEKKKRGRKKQLTGPIRKLNINIPEDIYEAFQEKCTSQGKTMTFEIVEFMKTYIKED